MLIIRSLWFNWAIFSDVTIGLVVYWSSVKRTLILFQLIVSFTYQFRILKHYHRWCLLLLNACRYFMLVIAVYAHTKNKDFLVCANVSERIIVRVSLTKRCLKLLAADVLSVLQRLRLKWRLRGRLGAKKFLGPKFLNLWEKAYVFYRFMLLGKQVSCNGNRLESRKILIPRIGFIQCWECWDLLQAICPWGESTEDQRLPLSLTHRIFVGIQSGSVWEWHGRCLDKRTKHRIYLSNGRSRSSISLSSMGANHFSNCPAEFRYRSTWNSPNVNGVWLLSRLDDVLVAKWLIVHSSRW